MASAFQYGLTVPRTLRGVVALGVPLGGRGPRHSEVRIATALAVLSVAVTVYGTALALRHHLGGTLFAEPFRLYLLAMAGTVQPVAGMLVVSRRPGHAVGWALVTSGLSLAGQVFLRAVWRTAEHADPISVAALWGMMWTWVVPTVAFATVPLFAPEGSWRIGWWWLLVAVVGLGAMVDEAVAIVGQRQFVIGADTIGNPLYHPGLAAIGDRLRWPIMLARFGGAPVCLAVRGWRLSRQAGPQRRAGLMFCAVYTCYAVEVWLSSTHSLPPMAQLFNQVCIGAVAAITLVMLLAGGRFHRLDRLARRVVLGVVLASALVGLYAIVVGVALRAVPTARSAGAALLAVLGVLVGLTLLPAARRLDRRADRLYYGARARPAEVAVLLMARLRAGLAPDQVPREVCEVVVTGLRLPAAALEVDTVDGTHRLAEIGTLDAAHGVERFELRYHTRSMGRLLVRPRPGQPSLDALDRDALGWLADHVAPAISALRLATELETSQQRLAHAREAERHRLRRDLHDELGPALAGLRLRLDTAGALLPADSPAAGLVIDAAAGITELVAGMRRITNVLRPPPLDAVGLGGAIRQFVDELRVGGLAIDVDLPGDLPTLPPAVEIVAYRIAAEALTNVVRHAGAGRAIVALTLSPGALRLVVADDGAGFDPGAVVPGVGLHSMTERAAEIGGLCLVTATPGAGSWVCAVLPTVAAAVV